MSLYEQYLRAETLLNQGLIRKDLSLGRPHGYVKDPRNRMKEMRDFLRCLGDPQKDIAAVHVAGTSGKGSVAAAIAGILTEAGIKVGLHVSPYLQSATEKIWVSDRYIDARAFADLVDWVMVVAKPRVHPDTPASIHGMASVAIAYEAFARHKVDIMVIEAGCGGRYDLTSFLDTAVAVITNIGLDHVKSLGPRIEDIAWHKAGIARNGVPLITGAEGSALEVIRQEADKRQSPLTHVPQTADVRQHNRELAIAAAAEAAKARGISLTPEIVEKGLRRILLPGRTETMPGEGPRVILDGAHNREKLQVAVEAALIKAKPGVKIAVVGFLGAKAEPNLLQPLKSRFDKVIATQPEVYAKASLPAVELGVMLRHLGYSGLVERDPFKALQKGIELAGNEGTVLITGSFYLVGQLRQAWYAKRDVVLAQSSWPSAGFI